MERQGGESISRSSAPACPARELTASIDGSVPEDGGLAVAFG